MDKDKIYSSYIKELLKCHEFVLKCEKVEKIDPMYEQYRQKYLQHRKIADRYYSLMQDHV